MSFIDNITVKQEVFDSKENKNHVLLLIEKYNLTILKKIKSEIKNLS